MTGTARDASIAAVKILIAQEPLPVEPTSLLVDRLLRLCAAAVRAVSVSGAGVSMMTETGVPGVAAASDPLSHLMEELQFIVGEGPCIDAFELRRPVLQPDLADGLFQRWPGYTPAALDHGVAGVFAFPLQVGAARLGVLDVYRDQPGSLRPEHLALALSFAEVAVTMLLDGQEGADPDEPAAGLDDALAYRSQLYHAQGMVMVQLRVGLAEAMVRLRAHAYAEDQRLGEVARDVVEGGLRLDLLGGP